MANLFHVGMEVVCIQTSSNFPSAMYKGRILTIREIDTFVPPRFTGQVGLRFVEERLGSTGRRSGKFIEHWFASSRYRPVEKTSTSTGMAILRKLLNTKQKETIDG